MLVRKNDNEILKEGGNGYFDDEDVASSEDIGYGISGVVHDHI